jgi:seryl-tRNA synthetase
VFTLLGWCFRHEPSVDPARMQAFRQREFVYVGEPERAERFRDLWIERGLEMLSALELSVESVVANDPFFGRSGRLLAAGQLQEALKYELVSPVCSTEKPTAIASSNCHRDHFGVPFEITTADGEPAHSACVGFGLERITLALLHSHGVEMSNWPVSVRDRLWA